MKTRNIWVGLASLALVAGAVAAPATIAPVATADAHIPAATLSCSVGQVSFLNYDRMATALVIIDGEVKVGEVIDGTPTGVAFNGHLQQFWELATDVEHTMVVTVRSRDARYNFDYSKTTTNCVPDLVSATFVPSDATCVDGVAVGNSATITASEGVITAYGYNGGPLRPIQPDTYTSPEIQPGSYVVQFVAPADSTFGDSTLLVFEHTFPAVPTDCEPPVEEPVIEEHEESSCASTTTYQTRTWITTDGVVSNEEISTRTLEQAEAIELGCYEPPVVDCEEGTVPGWLDEYGNPTSCITDEPCIPTAEQDADCNPIVVPPTKPLPPTGDLAVTGTDPTEPALWALGLVLAGAGLTFAGRRMGLV